MVRLPNEEARKGGPAFPPWGGAADRKETMPKEPTASRASFTAPERAFIWSMFQAGVASNDGWLSAEQRAMAADIAPRLHALPLARVREAGQAAPARKRKHAEPADPPPPPPAAEPPADPFDVPELLRRG